MLYISRFLCWATERFHTLGSSHSALPRNVFLTLTGIPVSSLTSSLWVCAGRMVAGGWALWSEQQLVRIPERVNRIQKGAQSLVMMAFHSFNMLPVERSQNVPKGHRCEEIRQWMVGAGRTQLLNYRSLGFEITQMHNTFVTVLSKHCSNLTRV